ETVAAGSPRGPSAPTPPPVPRRTCRPATRSARVRKGGRFRAGQGVGGAWEVLRESSRSSRLRVKDILCPLLISSSHNIGSGEGPELGSKGSLASETGRRYSGVCFPPSPPGESSEPDRSPSGRPDAMLGSSKEEPHEPQHRRPHQGSQTHLPGLPLPQPHQVRRCRPRPRHSSRRLDGNRIDRREAGTRVRVNAPGQRLVLPVTRAVLRPEPRGDE